jgi:homoaconitase/3-isopropylmalate dehydratase large subunit
MGYTLAEKIIKEHLVEGEMKPGAEIGIRVDQTLTQDATGTLVYLEFESLGIPRVRTELSVSYVDHNIIHIGSCSHRPPNTGSTFHRRGTEFRTTCTANVLASLGKYWLGQTVTPRREVAWECWPSVPGVRR